MPHFRSAATLMAAAFTLSLAACGSGAEEGVTTASSATPEASSPSTSPTAEASSSAQVAEGDFTPEGAQLAVGPPAHDAHGQGRLILLATAQPERLQAALPALGLNWLSRRSSSAARLVVA